MSDTERLIMYCRPWCGDCACARVWLDERGIDYIEIDVEADPAARERAAGFNGGRLHTPTFEFGERVCIDFRRGWLCETLGVSED